MTADGSRHPTFHGNGCLMEGTIIVKRATNSNKAAFTASWRPLRCGRESSQQSHSALTARQRIQPASPPLGVHRSPQHKILQEPCEKIEFAYFLNDGMTSLVALSHDGRSVEVGIVGKEGMIGMSLTAGLRLEIFRAIMQMSGCGVRIRSEVFGIFCFPLPRSTPNSAASPSCTACRLLNLPPVTGCMELTSAWLAGC